MDIHVDISVFCDQTSSYGVLSGTLNVPAVPTVGDKVSFLSPSNDVGVEATTKFRGAITVKAVTYVPGDPGQVLCDLEDVVLTSEADAKDFAEFLKAGFNLDFEPHSF
jgi:hypothetical protein